MTYSHRNRGSFCHIGSCNRVSVALWEPPSSALPLYREENILIALGNLELCVASFVADGTSALEESISDCSSSLEDSRLPLAGISKWKLS